MTTDEVDPIDEREGTDGEPEHKGHVLWLTGAWFCDTCNSPYCDNA